MPKTDKRIDAYIAKSPEYARPILTHLRALIHKVCPEVEEAMKWSSPAFDYKGPLVVMAAFKEHAHFNLWKAALIPGAKGILTDDDGKPAKMRQIKTLKDLPSDKVLTGFIKAGIKLNEEGKTVEKKTTPKKEIPIPEYFTKALSKNKKASATFEKFSPSQRREYLEWIVDAKTEDTRLKRLTQALEWMAEGKTRHWKYQK